ncbi:hypothetical protein LSH36_117g02054 [Paralvinella palmiformis]|uniref:VWFA domain-containing protein n=1 Tax=Paralvinella palmiformis TaxID=53620 RepID=A0AAD9JZ42_9ANNE|nr:hypothetical protein LSH36_117g02054 [Paralvinella palmiformis]
MSDQKLPMTFWLTLILLHHMSSETMSKLIDGSKMKNVISNIIENSLGATQFQFISATSNYLEGAFMAIGRLRTALEEDYRDNIYKRGLSRTDPRQCCLSDEDTPWYAETAASSPKDIVIVFDRSGSIAKKGLLPMILNASATLIASLNVGDRIITLKLLVLDDKHLTGKKDRTCYYDQLAFATSENKAYLQTWLRGITGVSPSDYMKALSAAFEYFDDSLEVKDDSRARNRVIVFLSDGMQDFAVADDNGILQLISERNARLNNSVIIVTYGLGTDMSSEAENLLKNMSYQTKADPAAGPIQNGKFTRIKTSTNLRAKVGSYYNIFNNGYDDKPIIITPYADFSELGK